MTNPTTQEPAPERQAPCQLCGVYTELRVGERWICEACRQARGSCCTEFDDDDEGQ